MERMVQVYNADLANTWGNLVSRVFEHDERSTSTARVPEVPAEAREGATRCAPSPMGCMRNTTPAWPRSTSPALPTAVQKLASRVNLYVEESAPWNLGEEASDAAGELAEVIYNALEAIRIIALYMAPFMPNTSAEVFRRLGLGEVAGRDRHPGGHGLGPAARQRRRGGGRPPLPAPGCRQLA